MYAYRFQPKDSKVIHQDCEDDGEDHAGGRMLHLLQVSLNINKLISISLNFLCNNGATLLKMTDESLTF